MTRHLPASGVGRMRTAIREKANQPSCWAGLRFGATFCVERCYSLKKHFSPYIIETPDTTIVLAVEVALPQSASRSHKFITHVQVPILFISIQFQVVFLIHIVDSNDSIIPLHRHILHSGYGERYHLLEMVHLINVFLLVPETGWLIHKYKVFVFVINHF